jgi:alkanesulfonate monooxygenase
VRQRKRPAWAAAKLIVSKVDPSTLQETEARFSQAESAGQQRQNLVRRQSAKDDYVVAPNFWAGLSVVRGGGAMAFVGTPDQVADRLIEYIDIGVSSFILSGYPNLEEASISGKALIPAVKRKLQERAQKAERSKAKDTEIVVN